MTTNIKMRSNKGSNHLHADFFFFSSMTNVGMIFLLSLLGGGGRGGVVFFGGVLGLGAGSPKVRGSFSIGLSKMGIITGAGFGASFFLIFLVFNFAYFSFTFSRKAFSGLNTTFLCACIKLALPVLGLTVSLSATS